MHIRTSRFHRAATLTLLIVGGCGELASEDTKPPALATMHGTLSPTSPMDVPQGTLRVALVWYVPSSEDSDACWDLSEEGARVSPLFERRLLLESVQQAVEVSPEFPSAFTLELTELPPAEAMREDDDGAQIAEGTLVAYRDGNGNGKLDPMTDDAASPDQVLSNDLQHTYGISGEDSNLTMRNWGYQVWYRDRPRKYSELLDLKSGFNVLEYHDYGAKVASEITLELLPTPELQTQLCMNECLFERRGDCPENPADLPAAPAGAISGFAQSGKAWVWEHGQSGFGYQAAYCLKVSGGYQYSSHRTIADNCSERLVTECSYGPAAEPSPDWPCSAYLDLQTRNYTSPEG